MSPQSKQKERAQLHKTLGEIAEQLRGKVDGWDFKTYVLGTLFYRYLCDHWSTSSTVSSGKRATPISTTPN